LDTELDKWDRIRRRYRCIAVVTVRRFFSDPKLLLNACWYVLKCRHGSILLIFGFFWFVLLWFFVSDYPPIR
jgi:hypothetical protein